MFNKNHPIWPWVCKLEDEGYHTDINSDINKVSYCYTYVVPDRTLYIPFNYKNCLFQFYQR